MLSSILLPEGGFHIVRMQFLDPAGHALIAFAGLETKAVAIPVATADFNNSRRPDGAFFGE